MKSTVEIRKTSITDLDVDAIGETFAERALEYIKRRIRR